MTAGGINCEVLKKWEKCSQFLVDNAKRPIQCSNNFYWIIAQSNSNKIYSKHVVAITGNTQDMEFETFHLRDEPVGSSYNIFTYMLRLRISCNLHILFTLSSCQLMIPLVKQTVLKMEQICTCYTLLCIFCIMYNLIYSINLRSIHVLNTTYFFCYNKKRFT